MAHPTVSRILVLYEGSKDEMQELQLKKEAKVNQKNEAREREKEKEAREKEKEAMEKEKEARDKEKEARDKEKEARRNERKRRASDGENATQGFGDASGTLAKFYYPFYYVLLVNYLIQFVLCLTTHRLMRQKACRRNSRRKLTIGLLNGRRKGGQS